MLFATMANWIQLLLFVYFAVMVTVDGADVTINYQDTDTMTISCRPGNSVSEIKEGFVLMTLGRRVDFNFDSKTIAEVKPNKVAELKDLTLTQRATVTGTADDNNVQRSLLQVVLRQVTCKDSGEYSCSITFYIASSPGVAIVTDNKNATVRSNPGPVKMYVSPRRISSPYSVNETVEFRCTADVGNPPQNRPWSWQWKYADSMMSWTSYPYTNRIQDEPIKPGSCANNGASVLNHLVSVDDNARMIRCVVNNNDDYSDNFTIYTQTPTTIVPGGVGGQESSSADIGVIVGAVLGALAVIAIVIVLIYFLWYRRRNAGEHYKTDEDKHPEAEPHPDHMAPNPVYETRPEPKNFRKKIADVKKGEVNPALDEPYTRHNSSRDDIPPYNYQNTGYAEDGGAMPMGSAV